VASSEARDVLHWMMCPASYRRIRMVIGNNKLKPSYHIVIIDVINILLNNVRLPTTMHAILATIFDGGQAIRRKQE
jgi:hypothetical protein